MRNILVATTAVAGIALAAPADANTVSVYGATLTPLNDSGVTGNAELTLDETANTLSVHITASGLVPDMVHVQHIHGLFDASGNPVDSTTPTSAVDTDMDGFIELAEGLTTYGPIIVPLSSGGVFPAAPTGTIDFTETYDLTDPLTFADGFTIDDLLPLALREIVLHGAFDPPGVGLAPGEIDSADGYEATLPVASGEIVRISAIPLPAAGLMLLTGLAGFGLFGGVARRRAAAA